MGGGGTTGGTRSGALAGGRGAIGAGIIGGARRCQGGAQASIWVGFAALEGDTAVGCLSNDWSYFEQERTEGTETKTLFSLFPPVRNTSIQLRDTTLALQLAQRGGDG